MEEEKPNNGCETEVFWFWLLLFWREIYQNETPRITYATKKKEKKKGMPGKKCWPIKRQWALISAEINFALCTPNPFLSVYKDRQQTAAREGTVGETS